MSDYVPAEVSRDRLRRAGWSVGDVTTAGGSCWVTGTNGENRVAAAGATADEAWWRACSQAAAVGMLAPARRPPR